MSPAITGRPAGMMGLHHVALLVKNFEACCDFYTNIIGMDVEWRPDEDNVYLNSGTDNLALHRLTTAEPLQAVQRLDHIGFIIKTVADVDRWHQFMCDNNVPIKVAPRTHRDGAHSFYCLDPDGITVQMIYHPPLSLGGSVNSS